MALTTERPKTYYEAIRRFARLGVPFTADDVIALVGVRDLDHTPNGANSQVGAAFARASREGMIERVSWTRSKQPHRKGGSIAVWQGVNRSQGELL